MVVVFVLFGRYLELRAKRSSSAALTSLLELGAKDAVVLRDGVEVLVAIFLYAATFFFGTANTNPSM